VRFLGQDVDMRICYALSALQDDYIDCLYSLFDSVIVRQVHQRRNRGSHGSARASASKDQMHKSNDCSGQDLELLKWYDGEAQDSVDFQKAEAVKASESELSPSGQPSKKNS
jgi:hypothetical protein